jgi:3-oxoacyl-[acyl-carrier protein] reductase
MKRALVTGASGDIGAAVVTTLTKRGFEVAAQFHTTAIEVPGVVAIRADLSTSDGVDALFAALPATWDGLDVLVNCLGGARPVRFGELSQQEWDQTIALNLTAPFLVIQRAIDLLARSRGAVVNLGSVASLTGGAFGPHYAAAKAGVIGLSRSAARELGPLGIRVNVVAPGPVRSRMTNSLTDEQLAGLIAATALGRVVTPDEVAEAVVWLSDAAATVTGQTLVVDGGRCFI